MRQLFYYKRNKSLLQNASGFLVQTVTVITKCDVYYKMRRYNYKIQNESVLLKKGWDT